MSTKSQPLTERIRDRIGTNTPGTIGFGDIGIHVLLVVIIAVLTLPIALAALFSTQTAVEVYQILNLTPGNSLVDNYVTVWTDYHFATYMTNSLVMTLVIIAGKLSFSLLAATALVYYDFPYQKQIFYIILFTLMLPIPVRIVPLYQMMVSWGWVNSFAGLTAPYIASATAVFLFRQRFLSIPASILETAKIDGVGPVKFLIYVLIPMSKGMIAGVTVIMFISMWNKYLWPLVVINDQSSQVAQVGLRYIQGTAAGGLTQWNLVMAASILALLPPLIVMVLARKPLLNTFGIEQ